MSTIVPKTELFELAMRGKVEILDHPDVDKIVDRKMRAPLHHLARAGCAEVLRHPRASTMKDEYGRTPALELAFLGLEEAKATLKRNRFSSQWRVAGIFDCDGGYDWYSNSQFRAIQDEKSFKSRKEAFESAREILEREIEKYADPESDAEVGPWVHILKVAREDGSEKFIMGLNVDWDESSEEWTVHRQNEREQAEYG